MSKKIMFEIALLAGFLFSVFAEELCAYAESKDELTQDVFRLHVIANSDSDEDQSLKIRVRDAVLEAGGDIFSGADSAEAAKRLAEDNIELFETAARDRIAAEGYDYPVRCEVEKTHFDKRVYGTAELPEGDYCALRVIIGDGGGKNWWCVMFPTLCLPAVTNTDEMLFQAQQDGIITTEELELMQNPENYEIRFYFAELFQKLLNRENNGA